LQGTGEPLLVCKGALEEMVALCSAVEDGDELLPLDDRSGLPGGRHMLAQVEGAV
jgi:Mg2+-importing ATPase